MKDGDLRDKVLTYIRRYGSSVSFVAFKVGVSREHLSRWIHNKNYAISNELELKISLFIRD